MIENAGCILYNGRCRQRKYQNKLTLGGLKELALRLHLPPVLRGETQVDFEK